MKVSLELPEKGIVVVAARDPELLSQRNCAHVAMNKRDFLRAVAEAEDGVEVIHRGQLRFVDRATFVSWLRKPGKQAGTGSKAANDATANLAAVDDTVAQELDELIQHAPVHAAKKGR